MTRDPVMDLRAAIAAHRATLDLVEAGRVVFGRTDTDADLVEAARLAVVACIDRCEAVGIVGARLDDLIRRASEAAGS